MPEGEMRIGGVNIKKGQKVSIVTPEGAPKPVQIGQPPDIETQNIPLSKLLPLINKKPEPKSDS